MLESYKKGRPNTYGKNLSSSDLRAMQSEAHNVADGSGRTDFCRRKRLHECISRRNLSYRECPLDCTVVEESTGVVAASY